MYVPGGVMRSYRPCRARPQPPSGCNGQCARAAERQSSRVTYSSPASPVSNRSCTGTGPAGMPPRAGPPPHSSTTSRRAYAKPAPHLRQAAQRSSGHRSPATDSPTQSKTTPAEANAGRGHVDDALARTGTARGQRGYTLPTARAFAHMPTALDQGRRTTKTGPQYTGGDLAPGIRTP